MATSGWLAAPEHAFLACGNGVASECILSFEGYLIACASVACC